MVIEFQVSSAKFASLLRNRFIATPLCIPQENAAGLFVEHTEFMTPPTLSSVPDTNVVVFTSPGSPTAIVGKRLRITQPVKLFIASRQAVINAAGGPTGTFALEPTVTISFDMRAEIGENLFPATDPFAPITSVNVIVEFADIEWGELDHFLSASEKASVKNTLHSFTQSSSVDLSSLSGLLDGSISILNAGMALDSSGDRVVLRIEVSPTAGNPVLSWLEFYGGSIGDWLGGRDFAFFLEGGLLAEVTESLVKAQLDSAIANPDPSVNQFVINEEPSATWSPVFSSFAEIETGGTPEVTVTFSGDARHACGPKDIGFTATMTFDFSVAQSGGSTSLQSTVNITLKLDPGDVAVCALGAGVLLGLAGALVGSIFGPIGAVVGALVGIVAGVVIVLVKAGSAGLGSAFDSDHQCQKVSSPDDDFVKLICSRNLPDIQSNLFGQLLADQAVGFLAGMALRGSINVTALEKSLSVTIQEPGWTQQVNCNTKQIDSTLNVWADFNDVTLVKVCELSKFGDPQNAFTFFVAESHTGGARVSFTFTPDGVYLRQPYDAKVLVKTSSGARAITFQPVPPFVPLEKDPTKLVGEIASICNPAYDKFWKGGWNPMWAVDPGPEGAMHDWTIAAVGVMPGDHISLLSATGPLVTEIADSTGTALLRTVVPLEVDRGGLILKRETASLLEVTRLDPGDRSHRLAVFQRLLIQQAAVAVSSKPRSLAALPAGRGMLICVTNAGIQVYSMDGTFPPRLTQQLLGRGFLGALGIGSRVVIYGDYGLAMLAPVNGGQLRLAKRVSGPVAHAEMRAGRIYAETNGTVSVYDRYLNHLQVWTAETVERVDFASEAADLGLEPRRDVLFPGLAITTVPNQGMNQPRREDSNPQTNAVVTAISRNRPARAQRSWWDDTVRLGRLYAHLNRAESEICVYSVGAEIAF